MASQLQTLQDQINRLTDIPSPAAPINSTFNIPTDLASTSGPDWSGQLGSSILPNLQETAGNLPGLAESFGPTLQGMYGNLMKQAMGPGAFQGTLNNLASRNVLNSSIASDALSKAGTNIATNVANQAYPSFLAGLEQKMQVPGVLGNLATLERTGTDPIQAYNLLARMLMY
jgi:hypothetical protein